MSCQEVLIMGVLYVSDHNTASDNKDVLAGTRMQTDRVKHGAAETD